MHFLQTFVWALASCIDLCLPGSSLANRLKRHRCLDLNASSMIMSFHFVFPFQPSQNLIGRTPNRGVSILNLNYSKAWLIAQIFYLVILAEISNLIHVVFNIRGDELAQFLTGIFFPSIGCPPAKGQNLIVAFQGTAK